MSSHENYLQAVKKLTQANTDYYNTGGSEYTDDEFDALLHETTTMGETHGWKDHEPLLTVGGADTGTLAEDTEVPHNPPMLSLTKAQTFQDVQDFLTRTTKPHPTLTYSFEPKLDGIAISAKYDKGQLTLVATRGDGRTGKDITARILELQPAGLPTKVPTGQTFEVRGELFTTFDDFNKANDTRSTINKKLTKLNENTTLLQQYKNPRNAVAGLVGAKTGTSPETLTPTEKLRFQGNNALNVSFATYDLILPEPLKTYTDEMVKARNMGFVPASDLLPAGFTQQWPTIEEQVNAFEELRKTLNAPTDGAVIKINENSVRETLGSTGHSPRWAIAYKYPPQRGMATIVSIERSVGRTGAVSYVANLTGAELDGSYVTRATLNNAEFIARLDVRVGDTVMLHKANDIIPQIIGVSPKHRPQGSKPYVAPDTCPNCQGKLDKSSVVWRCLNAGCAMIPELVHAVGKDALDIEGLNDAIIRRLVVEKVIKNVPDLYKLNKNVLSNLKMRETKDGEKVLLGQKNAERILTSLKASYNHPLWRIISSLAIRQLGVITARVLASEFKDFDKITNITHGTLSSMQGFGDEKATAIIEDLKRKRATIEEYRKLPFKNLKTVAPAINKFRGLKIAVTGTVDGYTRHELADKVASLGGVFVSTVNKDTGVLVADPASTSSKMALAKKHNVRVISPEVFKRMLED